MTNKEDEQRLTTEEAYELQKSDIPTNPFSLLTTLASNESKLPETEDES